MTHATLKPERTPEAAVDALLAEFLHPRAVARWIGISRRQLDNLHVQGRGPRRIKVGPTVMYAKSSVLEWLMQHEQAS